MPGLMTAKDVAAALQCSTSTVKRMQRNGQLYPIKVGKRLVRYSTSDIPAARSPNQTTAPQTTVPPRRAKAGLMRRKNSSLWYARWRCPTRGTRVTQPLCRDRQQAEQLLSQIQTALDSGQQILVGKAAKPTKPKPTTKPTNYHTLTLSECLDLIGDNLITAGRAMKILRIRFNQQKSGRKGATIRHHPKTGTANLP